MSHPTYQAMKGLAYSVLATTASCDHPKAKSKGYADGWQMLLDKHDDNEMVLFCGELPQVLSEAQVRVLLDGLAKEYTEFASWPDFAEACSEYPNWLPSRETVAQYLTRTAARGPAS